jgi:phosphoglycerol transferase MdoB-like AlkP superfamily enzyme
MIALVYSAWCAAMLRRVAEAKEPALRASRTFYAGWLFHTVSSVTVVTLLIVTLAWASKTSEPLLLLVSAALVSLLFAGGAAIYRTQVGSYLSLSALTLTLLIAGDVFELPRWDGAVPAVMGLCVAAISWLTLHWSRSQPCREVRATQPENWLGSPSILPARGCRSGANRWPCMR